jgi:prepilin signal peptidase PulO-like enzyme (type II secretory pathway)
MFSLAGLAKREDESTDPDPLPAWMGWGDLRLAVFMGLAGGIWGVVGVACAYVIGSVFGITWLAMGRSSVIPFGPFLALGLALALSWGNILLAWLPF